MKIEEPDAIVCYFCSTPGMEKKHRVETAKFVRILWRCSKCGREYRKDYGDKESPMSGRTAGIESSQRTPSPGQPERLCGVCKVVRALMFNEHATPSQWRG